MGEPVEERVAKLEAIVDNLTSEAEKSSEAREEYIPRIKAIESGIGSLALGMSELRGSIESLRETVVSNNHILETRVAVPEAQAAALYKERARVLRWVAGVLAAIIVAIAVSQITSYIDARRTKAAESRSATTKTKEH